MPSDPPAGPAPTVALVARDDRTVDQLRRLCALAGARLEVPESEPDIRRHWRATRTVLVDAAAAASLARSGAARRDGVLLLADDPVDAGVWQDALRLGAVRVATLPMDERAVLDHLLAHPAVDHPEGVVLGCVPGHGGAGASVLSVALAVAGHRAGLRTMLIDADPFGGGLDLLVGAELRGGATWADLAVARGVVRPEALESALPQVPGLGRLLSADRRTPGDLPAEAVDAVVAAARLGNDLVVVDLPSSCGRASGVAAGWCDRVLMVCAAGVRAAAAAAGVAGGLSPVCGDLRLVVRQPGRSRLRAPEIAGALGLRLAGVLPTSSSIARAAEEGTLPEAVRRGRIAALATVQARDTAGGRRLGAR